VLLTTAVTLINVLWVLRDRSAPSWDQSHYLYLAWAFQQALDHHGPVGFLHAVYTTDPSHAPLLPILLVPLSYVFGPGTTIGMALNVILWPVLLLSSGAVARHFFDDRARLLTIAFLAPMPLIVSLAHQVLQDFLLVTLTTVAVLLLLRTGGFMNRRASVGLGAVAAAGMLTKFSFFVGIAGPLAVTVVVGFLRCLDAYRTNGEWSTTRRVTANVGLMAIIATVPSLLWYVPNWATTWSYVRTQFAALPGSTVDPLALKNLGGFVIDTGENMSWLAVAIALVVAVVSLPRLFTWLLHRRPRRDDWLSAAFLAAWLVIPIAIVASNVNQDPRYLVASYPALAVVTGGLISAIRQPFVRGVLVVAVVLCLVIQTAQVNVPSYRTPLLPATVAVHTPAGWATITFTAGDGPAVTPTAVNVSLEIVQDLEAQSRGADGEIRPALVLLPELEPTANGNDLSYYAEVRHDPFTFVTLDTDQTSARLTAQLRQAQFVLFARQPPALAGPGAVPTLNLSDAARRMTPAMFDLFKPHPHYILIGADSGQSPYLAVLVRK